MSDEKKLNKIIPLVVYPFDVMISFGETDEEIKTRLTDLGIDVITDREKLSLSKTQDGYAVFLEGHQTLIRLQKFPETCYHYGVLAHEIFHAVTLILDNVGIPFTMGISDEAYAYLIEYLTKEIFTSINDIA